MSTMKIKVTNKAKVDKWLLPLNLTSCISTSISVLVVVVCVVCVCLCVLWLCLVWVCVVCVCVREGFVYGVCERVWVSVCFVCVCLVCVCGECV